MKPDILCLARSYDQAGLTGKYDQAVDVLQFDLDWKGGEGTPENPYGLYNRNEYVRTNMAWCRAV